MTNCIFEPRTDTTSATICKHCGQEKMLHNHNIQVPQLYTEEQVIGFSKWADDFGYMYNSNANCWYTQDGYKRTDEEMIYHYKKSLKQPKKD